MMKTIIFLVLFCFVLEVPGQSFEHPSNGQETYSLNGYWKFNTFLGEGSNYLDIQPTQQDIIIDNRQADKIEEKGNWKRVQQAERESQCWGGDYLRHHFADGQADSSYVRFHTRVPKTGYYEHFVYYPWSHHPSTQLYVKHAEGIFAKDFSQRNRTSKWLSLGIFKLEKGSNTYVEVTSHTKGTASADAIMLRPIEADRLFRERKNRDEAHLPAIDDAHWDALTVPGHWGMINAYANYTGKGWYRRIVELPPRWHQTDHERIYLQFDGVYHLTKVYVNGLYVGQNQGGFTPFEFDVTDQLKYDGTNVIAVEVDNHYLVGATWNWGGIIRDVRLVKHQDVRITYQYIHAEPDLTTGTAAYHIQLRIDNNSSYTRSLKVEAVIRKDVPLDSTYARIQIPSHTTREITLTGNLKADQVHLWHFDRPALYVLETTIAADSIPLHRKSDRFGIRKFEVTSTQMFLNGEAVRLVGFNRVSDHRYWGSSEPDALIKLDVDLMKEAGANMMRIMHGTQNKQLLDRCDEKGILIVEEVNVRELRNTELRPPDYPRAKYWLKSMVERDINHPCVIGWSVGNELVDHFQYVSSLYAYTKRLDPNRIALHVSNQGYKKGESPANNPLAYGDMIFQNIYSPSPGNIMDTIHSRWPDQAIFISEFGAQRFTTPSLDNDIPNLGEWYGHLRGQRPYITGASIWTYNDYKSGYNYTLPSENRAWGMVNAWRTKRRSFYRHQHENSPLSAMTIMPIDLQQQRAAISISIRTSDDLPSYSLQDYSVRYTFFDHQGRKIWEDAQAIPTLIPGMPPFSLDASWGKLKGKPFLFMAELVTPNGYTRHVAKHYFSPPAQPTVKEVEVSRNRLRVYTNKGFGAFEHQLSYRIDGVDMISPKTIAPYIELDSLPTGVDLSFRLIACNSNGASKPSRAFNIQTKGPLLAPVIWDAFIADNRLVVGYDGNWEDQSYQIRYGNNPKDLNQTASSNARGMMTIELEGQTPIYFQLMRITEMGSSQWSPIYQAQSGTFRMYE